MFKLFKLEVHPLIWHNGSKITIPIITNISQSIVNENNIKIVIVKANFYLNLCYSVRSLIRSPIRQRALKHHLIKTLSNLGMANV